MGRQNIGATLSLNSGNFFVNMKSAISASNNLKNSLNGTGKSSTALGDKMQSVSGKVLSVAKGITIAGATAATAVGAMVTKSVNSFAEYEQLIGGVETLFKGSAETVKGYANEAYKNAGLSANEYMSTVTSFSASLINSMGGDTEAAASRANMAINDMSDNANKMGSNMDTIMQTYQSISRGNYGMLDNLKLGYGGTKKEMERLIADAERMRAEMGKPIDYDISSFSDVVSAIHDIQTNMDITGTTSKEAATTISGSLSMLKASWNNTLTAITVGGEMFDNSIDNLVTSAMTFGKNIIPAIEGALGGVGHLVTGLAPIIAAELPNMVSSVLPSLVSAAGSLVSGIASQIPAIAGAVLSSVPAVLDGMAGMLGESSIGKLKSAFDNLKNSISTALSGIDTSVISNLASGIIPALCGALSLAMNTASGLISVANTLSSVIAGVAGAVTAYKIAVTAANVVEGIRNGLIAFSATMTGTQAAAFAPLTTATIAQIAATQALNVVTGAFGAIMTFVTSPIGLVVIAIGAVIAIGVLLYKHWDTVKQWAANLWNGIKNVFNGIKNTISNAWNSVKEKASAVWGGIQNVVSGKLNNIKSAYNEHGGGLKGITAATMTGLKEYYTIGYDAINALTGGKLGQMVDSVKTKMAPVINTVGEKFGAMKNMVSDKLNNIKSAYSEHGGGMKGVAMAYITTLKEYYTTGYDAINALTGGKLGQMVEGIKGKFSEVVGAVSSKIASIKTHISSIVGNVASTFSSVWSTISNTFENVKDKVVSIFDNVKSTISNAIATIKGYFNFNWSLPKIKLPHFKISGSFSLNPPSVPSFGVEWYKKGGIMTRPTMFGMNGTNAMVGGEAGAEAILPLDMLWSKLAQVMNNLNKDKALSVNNYVNVTVNSDSANADEIADTVAKKIVESIENM